MNQPKTNAVIIRTKTKELFQILQQVKAAVRGRSSKTLATTCEITVTDGKITFAVPGAVFSLECSTQGTCKATVPFLHFMRIVKDSKQEETEMIVRVGKLQLNSITLSAKTTFFENDKILRTIQLPMNCTEVQLLRLKMKGYTEEELNFNGLVLLIDKANENLNEILLDTYKKLKQYGITYEELEKMVKEKLFSNKSI
ncbi:hypothetical protein JYT36_00750 [Bacteroidales bacterium AH-315-N07]|nr:hypothetical protein [Bacteroidales bacterium AH-315-N07]